MKLRSFTSRVALAGAVAIVFLVVPTAPAQGEREQGRGGPDLSPDEQNLVKAIMLATSPAAKLKAAATLVEKHPKTSIRPRVAANLSDQIADVKDAAQKLALALDYQKVFKEQSEQDLIAPILIEAYASAGQPDQAFSTAAPFLARQPESLRLLVQLEIAGTDQARKKNNKFVDSSIQYGSKAIELLEANKKPAEMNDAAWTYYKGLLPNLYNSLGILKLAKGNLADAKASFIRATELAPADPFNYLMLAGILNDEYKSEAKQYQNLPAGPAKDAARNKVMTLMDATIDAYAHMIALSEGNAILQQVRQEYLQDLESFYKYRHNNSTAGMQQLIDKYKAPPK